MMPSRGIQVAGSSDTAAVELGRLLDFGPWTLQQKAVVLLSALAVIFDGMDIQIMGFAIPSIAKEWNIARAGFASVLAAGLFGVAVGSALGGLLGDRVGRRPALLGSVVFFALATLGMAGTHGLGTLLLLRLGAGLGIGGALPNAATLTAEYTPVARRPFATTVTIVCIPIGGLMAGLISANVLGEHSWRVLFLFGGLAPLVLALVLVVFLPESPRFLAREVRNQAKLRTVLQKIGRPVPAETEITSSEAATRSPASGPGALFVGGLAWDTLALWTAFFFCLLTVYLAFNWLPSVLVSSHLSAKEASQGLTWYNFGGIAGALAVGWWISLRGSRAPMAVSAALGTATAAVSAWLFASGASHGMVLTFIALHGLSVNAVQTTLYALATHLYATQVRATGVALALAVGRTGAIVSAYLGARLLTLHTPTYFSVLAGTMTVVLIAIVLLRGHIAGLAGRLETVQS